jgi:mRNA-degrading endonuclease RelE of RelBE toxin-antitoxin system
LEQLERFPWPAKAEALKGDLEGLYAQHVGRDKYRVIWWFDREIQTVVIVRVGPKDVPGGTIYDEVKPLESDSEEA